MSQGVSVPFFVGVLDALVRSFGNRLVATADMERIRSAAADLQATYLACSVDSDTRPAGEEQEDDE